MTSKAGAQRRENNGTRAETKSGGKKTDPDYRFGGAAARDPVALASHWYPGSLLSDSLTRMFHKLMRALAGLLFRMGILLSRAYE